MTSKEKASEMISKQFDVIAKASNYKGLKTEGEKKFYAIENLAKKCALIGVDSILKVVYLYDDTNVEYSYWQEVKEHIGNFGYKVAYDLRLNTQTQN